MSHHRNDPSLTAANFHPLAPLPPTPKRRPKPIPHGKITPAELRVMRQRHRRSQRQLADDLGYSQQNISGLEHGLWAIPYDLYPTLMMWDANNPRLGLALAVIDVQTHEVHRIIG